MFFSLYYYSIHKDVLVAKRANNFKGLESINGPSIIDVDSIFPHRVDINYGRSLVWFDVFQPKSNEVQKKLQK